MKLDQINEFIDLAKDNVAVEKKNLVSNMEELEEARASNEFLEKIAGDYIKYKDALLRQKERQKRELLKIIEYLDDILETQAVTKYNIHHTNNEQKRLIQEIKRIQSEMDQINLN